MKARRKPVIVEVLLFDQRKAERDQDLYPMVVDSEKYMSDNVALRTKPQRFYIDTLEGPLFVTDGDYIIRGVEGEYYACKPEIFYKTYEIIEEEGK